MEAGLILQHGGTVCRVTNCTGPHVILEHVQTLERRSVRRAELLSLLAVGDMIVLPNIPEGVASVDYPVYRSGDRLIDRTLEMFSDATRAHVRRVYDYIQQLRQLGYTTLRPTPLLKLDLERIVATKKSEDAISASTLYSWSLALDKAGGDIRALIPRFADRGGVKRSRLSIRANVALEEVLKAYEEDPKEKIRAVDVRKRVNHKLNTQYGDAVGFLETPSMLTCSRRIAAHFGSYEVAKRNKGKARADRDFNPTLPRPPALFPLQCLEFDDLDSGVFLVDSEGSGLPWGRAFITAGIDCYSQAPTGYEMSHLYRSTISARGAIINSILPKDPSAPEFSNCNSTLNVYGKPAVCVLDNALYNHADNFVELAVQVDFTLAWARPNTPRDKSEIEGFFAVVRREFFPKLPGYRGDKKSRDGLKEGMDGANLDLCEFKRLWGKWLVDSYMNNPRADGYTPRQKYEEGIRFTKPRLPIDLERLALLKTLPKTMHLKKNNLTFMGIQYTSPVIDRIAKQYGSKAEVKFRYDPSHLRWIYLEDPSSKYLVKVPCDQEFFPAVRFRTPYQQKLILKMCRVRGLKNPSLPEQLRGEEELRLLTSQLRHSKLRRERAKSARIGELPPSPDMPAPQDKPLKQVLISELESRILEIQDIPIDDAEEGWALPEMT